MWRLGRLEAVGLEGWQAGGAGAGRARVGMLEEGCQSKNLFSTISPKRAGGLDGWRAEGWRSWRAGGAGRLEGLGVPVVRRSTNDIEGIEAGAFLLCQDESLRKTISPKGDWRTGRLDSSKAGGLRAGGRRAGGLEGLEAWRAAVWRAARQPPAPPALQPARIPGASRPPKPPAVQPLQPSSLPALQPGLQPSPAPPALQLASPPAACQASRLQPSPAQPSPAQLNPAQMNGCWRLEGWEGEGPGLEGWGRRGWGLEGGSKNQLCTTSPKQELESRRAGGF